MSNGAFARRARDAQVEDELRATLNRTLRQLERARASREELVDAVYRAARDAASAMTIRPVRRPSLCPGRGSPEVAILTMADWQLGKRTPSYDSDVAEERVRRFVTLACRKIRENRAAVPEARVYLLGDLIEGEEIFAGQAHRIDASLYRQLFHGAQILAEAVREVAATVPYVRVVGVIGNHGAIGGPVRRSYHPESNADALTYAIARGLVAAPHVDWIETVTAGERAWYAVDEVLGRRWFLFHGDQVRSASFGIPWYGFQKRLLGWSTSVEPFDYAVSGHWHTPSRNVWNAITHWGAGSTESGNTYAQEFLASGGQAPSQWLLFQARRGIAAEHLLRLDEPDEPPAADSEGR